MSDPLLLELERRFAKEWQDVDYKSIPPRRMALMEAMQIAAKRSAKDENGLKIRYQVPWSILYEMAIAAEDPKAYICNLPDYFSGN